MSTEANGSSPGGNRVYGGPPAPTVPISGVPRRHTAVQLSADRDLVVGDSDVLGDLIEIQVEWQPLGWVIEDWIDTITVAPGEHAALSEAVVDGSSRVVGEASDESGARTDAGESSDTSTREVMRLATNVLTSGRGVYAGFGGKPGPASVDPVASLVQAVTGMLQLGYSSASADTHGHYGTDVQKELGAAIRRVSTELRSSRSQRTSDSVGRLLDHRKLRVVRNPSPARSLNLAVFSVARQWRVRTWRARRSRVVFVAVDHLSEPFTVDEVFRHRPVLAGVLLDKTLCDAVATVASSHRRAPAAPSPRLERIDGRVAFSDAPTRGSRVSIRVRERGGGTGARIPEAELPSTVRPGEVYQFHVSTLGHDEGDLLSVELETHAGQSGIDRRAEVSYLQLSAVRADGTRRQLVERDRRLELLAGTPRSLPLDRAPVTAPDPDVEAERLMEHLNAFRPYYRLAIDLQRDAVSRFVALGERSSAPAVRPLDMNPVGVAGAHIAFLCPDDEPDRPLDPDTDELMITTPTDGVMVEVVPGSGAADVDAGLWRPSELPTAEGAFVWPSPFSPFGPPAEQSGAAAASSPERPEQAAPAPSGPAAPADELNGLVRSLTSTMSDLIMSLKAAAPTAGTNGADAPGPAGG